MKHDILGDFICSICCERFIFKFDLALYRKWLFYAKCSGKIKNVIPLGGRKTIIMFPIPLGELET